MFCRGSLYTRLQQNWLPYFSLSGGETLLEVGECKYCKRGYFRWRKISQKCWNDLSRGGNYHDISPISFIKSYGCYFRVGVIFAKKAKSQTCQNYPNAKISTFTVK